MSDEKKPFQKMGDEMMLQIDHKDAQRRQNYRRAEAFLLWKFGPAYDDVRRFLKGSGMDWPSLFVEFVEVVEKDLLERMRYYEETALESFQLKIATGISPLTVSDDLFKSPPMMNSKEPRPPMRRLWKDDPGAYTHEELNKLKEALKDLRIRFVGLFNSYVRKTYHENSNPDNDLELALFDTDAALAIFEHKGKA